MHWLEMIGTACRLYSRGWRAGDRDMLMAEQDIAEQDIEGVCEVLGMLEKMQEGE